MRMISWAVGIGLVAVAIVRWAMPRQQKNVWQKGLGWTTGMMNPMSRYVMRAGKKMIRGMAR